jgi:hypothetical protein
MRALGWRGVVVHSIGGRALTVDIFISRYVPVRAAVATA